MFFIKWQFSSKAKIRGFLIILVKYLFTINTDIIIIRKNVA